MQFDTESCDLLQNFARQLKEGIGIGKKCSKRMEIVLHIQKDQKKIWEFLVGWHCGHAY